MPLVNLSKPGPRLASCVANEQCSSESSFVVSRLSDLVPRLQHLMRRHAPEIANSIVLEQGKTYADALGDVGRGLQVVESATAITSTLLGDKLEVANDMDTYVRRLPLGVAATISPFNFPAMIVLWSAALATVTGRLTEALTFANANEHPREHPYCKAFRERPWGYHDHCGAV